MSGQNETGVSSPTKAFIGVGSNIDPEHNITRALRMLQALTTVLKVSTFYRTAPIEGDQNPMYVNGVVEVLTFLTPLELKLNVMRTIEERLGRVRTTDANAPREIDLDILLYGDQVVDAGELCLPAPDIRSRPFVAVPLLELAPDLALPDTNERLRQLPIVSDDSSLETLAAFSTRLKRTVGDERAKSGRTDEGIAH